MIDRGRFGSLRRAPFLLALGLSPVAALAWLGCSDDDKGGTASTAVVDPGGTYGAEVTVTVVGRGRVTTNVAGLDCPDNCFEKRIFANAAADGAAGGVALKAIPTPGIKFLGWKFEAEPIGSRGRGSDTCNPIKRAATVPAVGMNDLEITLPFGETDGTPPAGKETACTGFTKVPLVYRVTAQFEGAFPVVPDAGAAQWFTK